MADNLSLPAGTKSGGKKRGSRKGSRKGGGVRRRIAARFAAFRTSDWAKLATFTAEVSGSAALASAASGYFGDKVKLWGKVDARLLAAAAALGFAKYGGRPSMAGHLTNVGVGVLTSWLTEQAHEVGASQSVPAAPPALEAPAEGLQLVGNVSVGNAERHLEKKLERLKRKADKKGVDWSEVRHSGAEPVRAAAPAARRAGPAAPWFRKFAHKRADAHPQGRFARAGY